jgi:hypothetical protein
MMALVNFLDQAQGAHGVGICVPTQGQGTGQLDDLFNFDLDKAPGSWHAGHGRRVPIYGRNARKL